MAVTMSFDDGRKPDRELTEIFNCYGIRGTFHLNGGNLGKTGYVQAEDIKTIYHGHEIAVHTWNHTFLKQLPVKMQMSEIDTDRIQMERLCGYPVRGMSWPYGSYSSELIQTAKNCGIEYARTTSDTGRFEMPEDFMQWNPTSHQSRDLDELIRRFFDGHRNDMRLLYLWGHSYEFDSREKWKRIEDFCRKIGRCEEIWYATNIEIKEYADVLKRLVYSADMKMIYNPSAKDAWLSIENVPICIPAGSIWKG